MNTRTIVEEAWSAIMISLMVFWAGSASAAIPLMTDDTGTQGKGKCQLELVGDYRHDEEERVTYNNSDLSATLTYGIIDPIDIVLSLPYQAWRTDDSDSSRAHTLRIFWQASSIRRQRTSILAWE